MKPTPRIYRSDNARHVAEFHKRVVDHIAAILDGKAPPNKLQVPPPKTVAEVFGFPRGTHPYVIGRYLGGDHSRGSIGRELLDRRRARELADLQRRAKNQQIRFQATSRGQPSPRDVACFVAKHKFHEGHGAVAEAAKDFKKHRSRIYVLLKVHDDYRKELESWRNHLLIFLEGRKMKGDRRPARAVLDEIDHLLMDTSTDAYVNKR
jgi:hypothetical protein